MNSRPSDRQATHAADALRLCVEETFPELEVFVEPWDVGYRLRGHVNEPMTERRLDFGDPEQGQADLPIRESDDELCRRLIPVIQQWLYGE